MKSLDYVTVRVYENNKCDENNPRLERQIEYIAKQLGRNNHSQDSHLAFILQICHPHCLCTHMNMFRLRNLMTHLNRLNPSMRHDILN